MKKVITFAIVAVMFGTPAFADTTATSTTGSASAAEASATNTADSSNNANVGNISQPITVNIDQSVTEPEGGTRSLNTSQITQDIKYSGEYSLKSVPNVSAPALTTTLTETCMGSTSAGAGWVGFGFSFGTTWRDSACVRRLDARQLSSLGYNLGAKELMCDSDKVRAALKRAGKPCFVDLPEQVQQEVNPTAVVADDAEARAAAGSGW